MLVGFWSLRGVRDDVRGCGARTHARRHRLVTAHPAIRLSHGCETREWVHGAAPGWGITSGVFVAPHERARVSIRVYTRGSVCFVGIVTVGIEAEVREVEPPLTIRHRGAAPSRAHRE